MNFIISKGRMRVAEVSDRRDVSERGETGVWFCENCVKFHIKAGQFLMTFDKEEFAAFSNSVFDCWSAAITLDDIRNGTPVAQGTPDALGNRVIW